MEQPQNNLFNKCINENSIDFVWKKDLKTFNSRITIPSLSGIQFSTWADWGPMYKFEGETDIIIQIEHTTAGGENKEDYTLPLKSIMLASPVLATVRKSQPLFYSFEDKKQNVVFQIFFDRNGHPCEVKVLSQQDNLEIYSVPLAS